MKRILCYGDSNTWGCSPADGTRFDVKTRWPMVMGSILGGDYYIIEDGLNGRTVLNLSPVDKKANGINHINTVIENYIPLYIAIISLGINDVFIGNEIPLRIITDGMAEIIDIIRNSHSLTELKNPEIIIMTPPLYNIEVEGSDFYQLQINKLLALPEFYLDLSLQKGCHYFNSSDYAKGSHIDGSHLDAETHILLGKKIAEFVQNGIK